MSKSTQEWRKFFYDKGVSEDLINKYLKYIEIIEKNNAPVIFELNHLSEILGLKVNYLSSAINSTKNHYRKFSIPKRSGGKREISTPYPALLTAQRWIKDEILSKQKIHESVHGFARNKSIISNASIHVGAKCLLKIDIKDFFPSIKINNIIRTFQQIGYANNVSFYLAALCCLDGSLPQGAATSPDLSNIICRSMDNRLNRLAKKCGLNYTRYADDMAFSGDVIHNSFVTLVIKIINDSGFEINNEKTFLSRNKSKRILTGISIAQETLKIPKNYKRALRRDVYFIKKYGLLSHLSKIKSRDPNYLDSIIGKLNFMLSVEKDSQFAITSLQRLRQIKEQLDHSS